MFQKPHPFTNKSFISECVESPTGERSIRVYHTKLSIYVPKKAHIHDPITIFKLATWMVKASEWVSEQKLYVPTKQSLKSIKHVLNNNKKIK
jgi:hypothetical protein